jgi:hypothetical protein
MRPLRDDRVKKGLISGVSGITPLDIFMAKKTAPKKLLSVMMP